MNEDVLAFFITWTCYGTYLPGDDRGWTKWHKGDQLPKPLLENWCRDQMTEVAVVLNETQREIVNQVVYDHCEIRGWKLHAVNCRSNHCHVVVTAVNYAGEQVRDQMKSWAKRRLKDHQRAQADFAGDLREQWWTRNGSVRKLFDDESLEAAVKYTIEAQDAGGSKANYQCIVAVGRKPSGPRTTRPIPSRHHHPSHNRPRLIAYCTGRLAPYRYLS